MRSFLAAVTVVLLGFAALVVGAVIAAIPTMLLWDWLMPEVFGLEEITLF